MIAEDIAAFDALMGAYRLPKGDDAEKAQRSAAIQNSLVGATNTPLRLRARLRGCHQVVAARRAAWVFRRDQRCRRRRARGANGPAQRGAQCRDQCSAACRPGIRR
jgi:hypothetical protein